MEPDKVEWIDRFLAIICGEIGGYTEEAEYYAIKNAEWWKDMTPETAVYHELRSWDNEYFYSQRGYV